MLWYGMSGPRVLGAVSRLTHTGPAVSLCNQILVISTLLSDFLVHKGGW